MADWQRLSELPDLRRVDIIAFDTETEDRGLTTGRGSAWPWRGGHVCGVSVAYHADGEIRAHYLPIRHPDTDNFDPAQVFGWLKDLVASDLRFVTQNGLYDWGWLRADGNVPMPPGDRLEEIGALATLVDENRYTYNLTDLCAWRGLPGKDEAVLQEAAEALVSKRKSRKKINAESLISKLPARFVGAYAEADAASTLALFENLYPIIELEKTQAAYRLEVDLLPMVLEMRRRGIRIDQAAAERTRDVILQKRDAALTELSEHLGTCVSMDEIAGRIWLEQTFDAHKIKYPRTEKGNPSFTAGKAGWMAGHSHWLPRLIATASKYDAAGNKFLEGHILGHIVNGRIHSEIHPHRSDEGGTRSLRFSYSDPPLQQMPSRDKELGPLIRSAFLPEEGETWAKPDISQQEFRLVVHYAVLRNLPGAKQVAELYRADRNADIHAIAAEMTDLVRDSAKAVNFAKIYGAGPKKFAEMIGKPLPEAQKIYEQYDRRMPFLSRLSEICQSKAKRLGYTELYDGARRHWNYWEARGKYVKGVGPCPLEEARRRRLDPTHPWFNGWLQRYKIHTALNALIQGSAARHTKLWMRACWREGVVPLLQMHDALDCSVTTREQGELVARLGCEAVRLEVPIYVDLKFGKNWGDATHTWEELHVPPEKSTAAPPSAPILIPPQEELDTTVKTTPAHVCAHCMSPPNGQEQSHAFGDAPIWLHDACFDAFIEARMQAEGVPWTVEPPRQSASQPPPPPLEPEFNPPPARTDNVRNDGQGNGYDYASGEAPRGSATTHYTYKDAQGLPYMRVIRTSAKSFPTKHWENGRWVTGWPQIVIPYRLPELLAAPASEGVFIAEGEKDAENVAALGLIATTNPGGAGKWQNELAQWFKGKELVYVLEDNDEPGRAHTAKVTAALRGVVGVIVTLSFPELPEKSDVSDWLALGGNKQLLLARAEEAKTRSVTRRGYIATNLATVKPRAIQWIWPGHLARGGLELMAGVPGLGKSQIHCQFVACVTTGRAWPNGTPGITPCRAIMLTAEDTTDDTLVPRLKAAGANLTLVDELKAVRRNDHEEMFLLSEDLEKLEMMIRDYGDVGLVLVDPITSYMGHGKHFDSHRATDVRSQLMPLKKLAERTTVAISAVTHPSKNASARAIDHFIGSQAFIAAARIGHLCLEEMEDTEEGRCKTGRGLFTNPKTNIAAMQATLAYRIDVVDVGFDEDAGATISAPVVRWDGEAAITADEALAAAKAKKKSGYPVQEFLIDILAGGPVLTSTVIQRGAARGFSPDQLRYAKTKLDIEDFKKEFQGPSFWRLPSNGNIETQTHPSKNQFPS